MNNLKYKVGDKVRIKSLDWYNENKNEDGRVACGYHIFTKDMSKFCGCTMIVCNRTNLGVMTMGGSASYWTDEMIEGLVEEENNDCEKCGLIRNSTGCLFMDNCPYNKQKNIIEIPEDYVIKDENGNIINATKIVLEKKGKGYPKTFVDCCAILYPNDNFQIVSQRVKGHKGDLLFRFQKLLICRDAYWKIAGDWRPEFRFGKKKYCSMAKDNKVISATVEETNRILAFPTAEMRDAFYEAFKEEIEICKELL